MFCRINLMRSDCMCTTIGFSYSEGIVFGRTLEMGVTLDNHMTYIPKDYAGFIKTKDTDYASKYAVIGTGFLKLPSLGDGINEMGLMGSNNLLQIGRASCRERE